MDDLKRITLSSVASMMKHASVNISTGDACFLDELSFFRVRARSFSVPDTKNDRIVSYSIDDIKKMLTCKIKQLKFEEKMDNLVFTTENNTTKKLFPVENSMDAFDLVGKFSSLESVFEYNLNSNDIKKAMVFNVNHNDYNAFNKSFEIFIDKDRMLTIVRSDGMSMAVVFKRKSEHFEMDIFDEEISKMSISIDYAKLIKNFDEFKLKKLQDDVVVSSIDGVDVFTSFGNFNDIRAKMNFENILKNKSTSSFVIFKRSEFEKISEEFKKLNQKDERGLILEIESSEFRIKNFENSSKSSIQIKNTEQKNAKLIFTFGQLDNIISVLSSSGCENVKLGFVPYGNLNAYLCFMEDVSCEESFQLVCLSCNDKS